MSWRWIAFSSDAVPTHLLTREAIGLCLEHLADPAGVLAVNISNRFLDLEPVMADSARHFELYATVLDTNGDLPVPVRSIWVLLSRSREMLDAVEIAEAARRLIPVQVAWTDQYSSHVRASATARFGLASFMLDPAFASGLCALRLRGCRRGCRHRKPSRDRSFRRSGD